MFKNSSPKAFFTFSSVVAATVLGLSSAIVRAAPVSDSFAFSESQKDALSCSNKTSESCEIFTTGKYTAKGLVFAGDTNVLELIAVETTDADITITIGQSTFGGVIGTASKLGSRSATFDLKDVDCAKTPCKTNIHGAVTFGLSTKGLSVSISTKTGATANETFEDSIIANLFATNNAAFTTNFNVAVVVDGTHTDSFAVAVGGTATTKATIKNSGTFDLNTVKVKSTGIIE